MLILALENVRENWEEFAKTDPLWAIYTAKDKKGNKWKKDEFFDTGKAYVKNLLHHIESLNVNISFGRALDFGCGVGRITQALADYYTEVNGVDISATMIELAKKFNTHGDKSKYFLNDREDLKLFKDNSFDVVHAVIVLQHMKPKYAKKYIKEFIRITSPNGLIVFQQPSGVPARQWPKELLLRTMFHAKRLFEKSGPVMEMHTIKLKDMVAFLKENHVELIDVQKDAYASSRWNSYTYYVKKPALTSNQKGT